MHDLLELADCLVVPHGLDQAPQPVLSRGRPQSLEPDGLRLGPWLVGDLGERSASPQTQPAVEDREGLLGCLVQHGRGLRQIDLEGVRIDLMACQVQTGSARDRR